MLYPNHEPRLQNEHQVNNWPYKLVEATSWYEYHNQFLDGIQVVVEHHKAHQFLEIKLLVRHSYAALQNIHQHAVPLKRVKFLSIPVQALKPVTHLIQPIAASLPKSLRPQ